MREVIQDTQGEVRRWTAKRKAELVLDLMKGKVEISEVSRAYDLCPSEIEGWMEQALSGMENGLKNKPKDMYMQHEAQVKVLQAKIGELVLELDARKKLQALIDREEKRC